MSARAGIRTQVNWLEASYSATELPTHIIIYFMRVLKVFVYKKYAQDRIRQKISLKFLVRLSFQSQKQKSRRNLKKAGLVFV